LFDLKCEAHHVCAQLVTVPETGVRQQIYMHSEGCLINNHDTALGAFLM